MFRLLRLIEQYFEPVIIVTSLGLVITLLFADVVARFAFQTSVFWAGEVASFAFVYMIYFGISYAIREKRHLRVTMLVEMAPPLVQRALLALAEVVFLVYSVIVCWLGVVITTNAIDRGQILSATQWPTAFLYAAIIFSGALCVLRLLYSLWMIVRHGETVLSSPSGGAA
ncbi:TRAP transporter small permease [Fodinicurvata sp. EGI_FJ10296]|uniref:TRAP transporter small permease n=1 Tax=Fodinicurvata sp. EGI_FJ10296 TaxID=3231908 RepID=UPI0034568678